MLFLVLFDLLDCQAKEDVVNIFCFLSGLCFGHYVVNINKNHGLAKQFSDDLNFFVQNYNSKNNVDFRSQYVPKYTPLEERDFCSYFDDLKYKQTMRDPNNYF